MCKYHLWVEDKDCQAKQPYPPPLTQWSMIACILLHTQTYSPGCTLAEFYLNNQYKHTHTNTASKHTINVYGQFDNTLWYHRIVHKQKSIANVLDCRGSNGLRHRICTKERKITKQKKVTREYKRSLVSRCGQT